MKALFVGLGSIGQRHLRNLKKLNPEIDIIAFRSSRTAPVLSNDNKVVKNATIKKHYDLIEFDSISDALNQKPDMVFVTNPSSLHLNIAKKALLNGAFVFIEKPLSHELQGVEDLINAEKRFEGKRVALGYHYRFHPMLKLLKKTLNKGKIGNLISANFVTGSYMPDWHPYEDYKNSYAARKDLGGGALLSQIHDFDHAIWMFGRPERLFCVGGQLSNLKIDVEDSVKVLLEFKNKDKFLPVSINIDYLHWPPSRTISVIGDAGSIQCDLEKMKLVINDRINNTFERLEFSAYSREDCFEDEMSNFLAFVSNQEDITSDLISGIESLKVALAAKESMNSGQVKKLKWNSYE
ncbi:Gfo/Idh/MocA family oxidoreductase [Candidatus Thioglobus sp.]|nr:Gfo/Idh/MocA family oxidoreductase [Candidatus Thioglobus sp.]